jgi:uncharacterized protein YqiB (DUF1249 family)
MQGLMELVLQADGITPEMMEQQRQRVNLIQELVEASDEQLEALITKNDSKIDSQFVQTMSVMAQRLAQTGRTDVAERLMLTQQVILEVSSFGRQLMEQQARQEAMVEEVAGEVQAMGAGAKRSDFLALARKYADDTMRLQALVGVARPVFDNQFFQELTVAIGQEAAAERPALEALQDRLKQLIEIIDEQTEMQMRAAANVLQALLNVPPADLDETLRANLPLLNDTFMAVLTANLQEAERRKDMNALARLRQVYDRVVAVMQQTMQPELILVNQLLSTETDDEAQTILKEGIEEFGESLVEMMDAIGQILNSQGEFEVLSRLTSLRKEAEALLQAQ